MDTRSQTIADEPPRNSPPEPLWMGSDKNSGSPSHDQPSSSSSSSHCRQQQHSSIHGSSYLHARTLTHSPAHAFEVPSATYLLTCGSHKSSSPQQRHSRSHSCWSIDESASDDDAHQLIVELCSSHLILASPSDQSAATSSSQQARQLVGG